jgi:FMN-dependent NADH-azoreductase
MTQILVLNSSVLGDDSVSKTLVGDTVRQLMFTHRGAQVVHRDLGDSPIPHLTTATAKGVRGIPTTPAELSTRALSDELIAEVRAADILVIGSAMYNFSMATGLRSWFDHVLRSGETFSYSESGPQGLLTDKRVIVIESRGGMYTQGPTQSMDFQEPYLKAMLSFVGLTDVSFIHAEKLGYGPEARAAAIASARARIATVATERVAQPA